ncbi:MAG: hypothetical protein IJS28_08285 [Synergistaceae bacterium]|nr:hypothetical protein [Synergistaceae bacterium]
MDPIEAEVDAIRKELWEEIKDLSPEEMCEVITKRTDPLIKEFHMKVSKRKPRELVYHPRQPYENYADL